MIFCIFSECHNYCGAKSREAPYTAKRISLLYREGIINSHQLSFIDLNCFDRVCKNIKSFAAISLGIIAQFPIWNAKGLNIKGRYHRFISGKISSFLFDNKGMLIICLNVQFYDALLYTFMKVYKESLATFHLRGWFMKMWKFYVTDFRMTQT